MDPGDEVIIPEPFYANYNGFAVAAGIKVVPVPSYIENGFALPPIEAFEKLITPRTKAIMICNPNNPTGYLYSREELEKLRDMVLKHNLYLFSDEVYREFCYDGLTHYSVLNLEGLEQHAVMFDSVSKRFSACGVRIGAVISRNSELMATFMKFAQARLSPPGLGQIAAEAALDTPQSYFDDVVKEYIARRNFLVDSLNAIPGVFCPRPKGAFYTTVRLPVENADHFAKWLLTDFQYNNQTVMLAPAAGFYATPGLGLNEVRIAYVLKLEDLKNAIECLRIALDQYNKLR
jgi:aspartate aminotransferase